VALLIWLLLHSIHRALKNKKTQKKRPKAKPEPTLSLADLTKANDEYSKKIKNLSKEIKDLQDEITTARQSRDDAKEKAKNAKNEAEEKAQKEIDRINKDADTRIKFAKQNESLAIKRANEAEEEAQKKADKRIEEITRELNSKVEAANNRAAETEKRARQAIADAKATTIKERDEEWGKLVRLAKRLRELLDTVPDDAFGSAGETLKAGVAEYYTEIEKITALDNSIKDRLDKIRSFSLKLLQYPSGCWLHLLGRIYSYLSVETLRNQLDNDGLSLNTVDEAFRTLSAILAMQGIVVANCSPGYDSNHDPMTARLFQLDTQVDRITRWLGGRDRVQEEIPNHGGTIYDFGQLAYYTYEDTTIHQGSVIYYA
jgi:DNA repair exonuclease SbcCD ATPase subunit